MGTKNKNSSKKMKNSKMDSKVSHKSKAKETLVNNTQQKQTKTSMKKSLSKFYFDRKPPSRYTPQQIEERREYIRNTVLKGNQQFQEDLNSQWYSEHFTDDYSSSNPFFQLENSKEISSLSPEFSDLQQIQEQHQTLQNSSQCIYNPSNQRHVSFSKDSEIHHLQVDRTIPGKDHPIFDTKKTWITQLMSKKPKKSSIKIQVDRKGGYFQSPILCAQSDSLNENNMSAIQQYLQQELNIDSTIQIDYSTYRVVYDYDKQQIIVNTHFCYTQ